MERLELGPIDPSLSVAELRESYARMIDSAHKAGELVCALEEVMKKCDMHLDALRSLYSVRDLENNPEVQETYENASERLLRAHTALIEARQTADDAQLIASTIQEEINRRNT